MGPVFAFCETAMNCTLIDFSIEAEVPRRLVPATLPRSRVDFLFESGMLLTPEASPTAAEEAGGA